jgi:hypothetical protein
MVAGGTLLTSRAGLFLRVLAGHARVRRGGRDRPPTARTGSARVDAGRHERRAVRSPRRALVAVIATL